MAGVGSLRKRRRVMFWCAIGGCALFTMAILIGVIVFRSKLFTARDIAIEGTNQVSQADVMTFLKANIGRGLLSPVAGFENMLVWPSDFSEVSLASLPGVKAMTIEKDYFAHHITVNVAERPLYGIWCVEGEDERCFWFDDEGVMFKPALVTEGSFIRRVKDSSGRTLGIGIVVLSPRFMPALFSIFDVIQKSNVQVREVELSDLGLEEVTVLTYDGPTLLFSLRVPADEALVALDTLSQKPGLKHLTAIDFRTEHRVYYH